VDIKFSKNRVAQLKGILAKFKGNRMKTMLSEERRKKVKIQQRGQKRTLRNDKHPIESLGTCYLSRISSRDNVKVQGCIGIRTVFDPGEHAD